MVVAVTTSAGGTIKTATGTPQEVLDHLNPSSGASISGGKILAAGFTAATVAYVMYAV